jgi:hypothetical protein
VYKDFALEMNKSVLNWTQVYKAIFRKHLMLSTNKDPTVWLDGAKPVRFQK